MMRFLLLLLFFLFAYYVLKAVIRATVMTVRKENDGPSRPSRQMGEEMVLDPECQTYVVKSRAVTRRINGTLCSFCSENCANRFEQKSRT